MLGDLADATESYGNRTKSELQELGQYPADPPPPEEGQEPEPPPVLSDGENGQVAAFVEKAEAEVKELLGATVDKFESLCIAGEVESRMMALQHFGLIPQEEHDGDVTQPLPAGSTYTATHNGGRRLAQASMLADDEAGSGCEDVAGSCMGTCPSGLGCGSDGHGCVCKPAPMADGVYETTVWAAFPGDGNGTNHAPQPRIPAPIAY